MSNRPKKLKEHNASPTLASCWAKTNFNTGMPALTVRDHCLHVGAVAEHIINLLPSQLLDYLPHGAATLTALHDIGKITIGFQKKCPLWSYFPNVHCAGLEGNHAIISQAFLGEFITERNPAHWSISLGGHALNHQSPITNF